MKLYNKILNPGLLLLFTMLVLFGSCMKDKLDFEKVSNRVEYNISRRHSYFLFENGFDLHA
jgi:hypothetical protein